VSHEYLSDEQVRRYGAFVADPTPEELERFFFLDAAALEAARTKRRRHNRLGWAVQWGTVRMLGTFLEDPIDVPWVVVDYAAEQLGIDDPSCVKDYSERPQTRYEHAWEIRDLLGFRDFTDAEQEITQYVASRVATTRDSRRELFDRAVLALIEKRVLLPGITTMSRLVTEIRRAGLEEINAAVVAPTPVHTRRELIETLEVPEGKRVSTLEWMRTPVVKLTGKGMVDALDRASFVLGLGTGAIDLSVVAPVKLAELASFGLHAKAPRIKDLRGERRVATLVATTRALEASSVDDALLLFDLLMSTKLLSGATRASNKEKLKTFPKLKTAAAKMAAAWAIVLAERPEGQAPASVPEMMAAVEQVVSREDLAAAVESVRELLLPPGESDDGDAEWRAALVDRYATVKPFIDMLASVIPWGCTEAGTELLAALRALPKLLAARKPGMDHIRGFEGLVTGSWRRLVFANPKLEAPLIDRPAYVFAVLEQLHEALRRRDVYAVGASKWGDPRVHLIEPRLWTRERERMLTALGLPAEPREYLAELAEILDGAFKQVGAGLASNDAARIKDGKLSLARLEAAPLPEGFQAVHDAVAAMLPRIDYPELILEVNARTGFLDAMPHISGSEARRDDLDLSLAALLVARSCNIGLVPVAKPGTAALGESRLIGVEKGYFHGEGIGKASAILVDSQAEIPITADWGGGLVASTDGLRFVVPVRSGT
jgi:TnpA family transposase